MVPRSPFRERVLRELHSEEHDKYLAEFHKIYDLGDPEASMGAVQLLVVQRVTWLIFMIGEMLMSQQSDIDKLASELQTVGTNLGTALTALQAEVATLKNNAPQLDLTALDAAVVGVASAANAIGSAVTTPTVAAPTVTGLSPASGSMAGGDTVTVSGTGFTGATAINFGTEAAASFSVVSDTEITAVTPAWTSVGSGDVIVTTSAGTSAISSASVFTWS